MTKLNAYDAACLRAVGIGEGNRNTQHMNRKLDTMGLVRWVPLNRFEGAWRITEAGIAALRKKA